MLKFWKTSNLSTLSEMQGTSRFSHSFFKFGDKVFRKSIGIPMGIDPAPQMDNLYYYEAKFMEMLTKEN